MSREIKEAVQKLAGTHLGDQINLCDATVAAVNQAARTCTCTPIGGKAVTDLQNVMLMPDVDDGFLKIPAIGSTVRVQWSTRNEPYIVMYSQLQKVILVTISGIQFQGGELGGIPISANIAEALNLVIDAFNLLNSKVNALAPTPIIPPLEEITVESIENGFITHGGA